MKRKVQHKAVLNQILRDVRLSPNRRMLGELLALWVDCEDVDQKERIFKIIEAQFGSSVRTKWLDGDDPNIETGMSKAEKEATEKLKSFFAGVEQKEEFV